MRPRIGSLFSGYGGLDLATLDVLGGSIAWHAETNPAATAVLARHWPAVPNHGDVTGITWSTVEPVDVLTGGFPCQDLSHAGRRAGLRPHTRSGLWAHMAQAIHDLQPHLVVIENVRGLLSADAACQLEPCPWCLGNGHDRPLRALGAVLGDLADLGYDASWCGLRAADIGAPHGRYRIFLAAAHTAGPRRRHGHAGRGLQPQQPGAHHRAAAYPHHVGGQRHRHPRDRSHRPAHHRGTAAHADQSGPQGTQPAAGHDLSAWGDYAPAIHHWAQLLRRPAPAATHPGRNGKPQLAPAFVEWLMGLAPGWITSTAGLTRAQQLRLLGNGVVPQQATTALTQLLDTTSTRHDHQEAAA